MRFLPWLLALGCIPHLETTGTYDTDVGPVGSWEAPENRWPLATPPAALVGEGWEPGQTVPDVRVADQHGDVVSLWQFHGQVVLLDISTMWCAPCRDLAQDTQHTQESYASEGFVYLTVLQESVEGGPPILEDLNLWADNYGIDGPVVGDGDKSTAGAVQQNQFPAVLVIGRDLTVEQRVNPPTDASVRAAIERAL